MSYTIDKKTGDVVISGWEQGIADDPFAGISDIRNLNLISIPKEASVNFATSKISSPNASGTLVSADAGADTVTLNDNSVESGAWVVFSGGGVGNGITAGVAYKLVLVSGNTYSVFTNYPGTAVLNITGNSTGTYVTVNMGQPKYFAFDGSKYWMVDSTGYVWSDAVTTQGTTAYWTYTGNKINNNSNGNGLVYYQASDGAGYIFVFSDGSIDYSLTAAASVDWNYQWSWTLGTVGSWSATPTSVLKSGVVGTPIHYAIVAPDNKVYFTDANWIGRWYQKDPNIAFIPTTLTTYVADQTAVLPFTDTAQCISPLGNNLLIGGKLNVVYPWDTFNSLPNYPILLPEYNTVQIVTVNTTAFIFVGNRGRIYYSNGSQAQLYKKIPDHLSGTIEPYFTWGGATSNKNQLYFSALVTSNGGVANSNYGGLWAVDLDTKAIRLTNKLSYGTYLGYATTLIPNFGSAPAGTGLYIGWNSGATTYGLDITIGTPYNAGQATIDSDLVPIGTFLKPTTNGRVEFKLSVPIVSGESVKLQYRQAFSDSFTDVSTTTLFTYATSTVGGGTGWNAYAGVYQNIPFQNSQWIQLRAVLTSTTVSPSYVRLTELRLGN